MSPEMERELESAVKSDVPMADVVALLRQYKDRGVSQLEAYAVMERLHLSATEDVVDDRILEVADFVAGFCAPHMKIWDGTLASTRR